MHHGELPFLELVWLPSHLLTFPAVVSERSVQALVGGFDRSCTIADVRTVRWEGTEREEMAPAQESGREVFTPSVDTDTAHELATRELTRVLARRPGFRGGAVPTAESSELVQYPYWVYYYGRRSPLGGAQRIDVRLLDAVSGQPTGAKIKIALLAALSSQRAATEPAAKSSR